MISHPIMRVLDVSGGCAICVRLIGKVECACNVLPEVMDNGISQRYYSRAKTHGYINNRSGREVYLYLIR